MYELLKHTFAGLEVRRAREGDKVYTNTGVVYGTICAVYPCANTVAVQLPNNKIRLLWNGNQLIANPKTPGALAYERIGVTNLCGLSNAELFVGEPTKKYVEAQEFDSAVVVDVDHNHACEGYITFIDRKIGRLTMYIHNIGLIAFSKSTISRCGRYKLEGEYHCCMAPA